MKTFIALCLCGLSIPLSAQTTLRTFTSPDGIFRFKYSDVLVDCMSAGKQENGTGSSVPESCMSQGAICDGPGSEGSTMACLAYPKDKFEDKPHFVAASFYVSEIHSAKTEKKCLKGSPDWFVINSKAGTTTINQVIYETFEIGDNWAGSGESGPAYRTFHEGKCYELGIQIVI
jgi:hypothetical protein